MSLTELELDTSTGSPVPPESLHSVTTYLPKWQNIRDFLDQKPELLMSLKTLYPRIIVQRNIVELTGHITKFAGVPESFGCLLYPSLEAAEHQIAYVADSKRGNEVMNKDDLSLRVFELDVRYYAVFFPKDKTGVVMHMWSYGGLGVSSRMAVESLRHVKKLKELKDDIPRLNDWETDTKPTLQKRIADLLERAPVGVERERKVQPQDVYLYSCGMAAIYWLHDYLLKTRGSTTILYGIAYHNTEDVLERWGPSLKHFGFGSPEELDEIEAFCESEMKEGRSIQALWTEFPGNPQLTTPDLGRLRKLADKYGFVLCVDETVGSFCNVDVMGADGADVVLTSLSKSFNGWAETMAGSAALNPLSPIYDELKTLYEKRYHNDVCPQDLAQLEENSRDYMERSAVFNRNAEAVVDFLQSRAQDSKSAVKEVLYPYIHRDLPNYNARKRPATEDFQPGFGCLFTVDFESLPTAIAFYDELGKYIHCGPHLGAHRTLALNYAHLAMGLGYLWPTNFAMPETSVRVSVGFKDDAGDLVKIFGKAVEVADKKKVELE